MRLIDADALTNRIEADKKQDNISPGNFFLFKAYIMDAPTIEQPNGNLISRQDALDILDDFEADIELGKKDSYKVHREKLLSIHSAYHPLCALADRECPFQGKEYAWCLTCPHISEEDRDLVKKVIEPKTGEWMRLEREENVYDLHGVPTWGVNYMCDKCGFITTAIQDHFGQYKWCPSCGADMKGGEDE